MKEEVTLIKGRWQTQEQQAFLKAYEELTKKGQDLTGGPSDPIWELIKENYVKTRKPRQIQVHCKKYTQTFGKHATPCIMDEVDIFLPCTECKNTFTKPTWTREEINIHKYAYICTFCLEDPIVQAKMRERRILTQTKQDTKIVEEQSEDKPLQNTQSQNAQSQQQNIPSQQQNIQTIQRQQQIKEPIQMKQEEKIQEQHFNKQPNKSKQEEINNKKRKVNLNIDSKLKMNEKKFVMMVDDPATPPSKSGKGKTHTISSPSKILGKETTFKKIQKENIPKEKHNTKPHKNKTQKEIINMTMQPSKRVRISPNNRQERRLETTSSNIWTMQKENQMTTASSIELEYWLTRQSHMNPSVFGRPLKKRPYSFFTTSSSTVHMV